MTKPSKGTRSGKHRRKKKKKVFLSILLLIVLIGIVGAGYLFVEYKMALQKSRADIDQNLKSDIEFKGVEDELGRVNILLLGVDTRGTEKSRTDTIMIAQYNPETKKSKLVSLMRDIYVDIPGHRKNKLNAAYAFGETELLRKTIKENFDVDLQYYALIDFKGFAKTIDVAFPKGVEIDVEQKMSKGIGMTLQPGVQQLNGEQLLGYVRWRGGPDSDFGRVNRQQKVMQILADKLASVQGVLKLPRMVGTIQPYISTNLSYANLLGMGTSFLTDSNQDIQKLTIPIDGTARDARHSVGLVLEIDMEKNKKALKAFLNE
ncbi:LCP family protein [Bacillus cihuensis]|uniref:LCP family protein n=1 Tax=Bacillus cihuensis TaxID=1208599 RepID=UPI0003FC1138|nr:LCP family protein [Bacillus cihuensis]